MTDSNMGTAHENTLVFAEPTSELRDEDITRRSENDNAGYVMHCGYILTSIQRS